MIYFVAPRSSQRFLAAALTLALAFGQSPLVALGAPRTNPRIGLVDAYQAPRAAAATGAGWQRVRFQWPVLQPNGPDEWKPGEISDAQIRREVAAGRQIIGLVIGTPAWALDGSGIPRGLYLPESDPANVWATFVRSIVTRYRGKIDHWIIWNEPDVWDSSHPGFTWPGSVDDFVQLTKVAYLAAHAANPNAVIHLTGVTHHWDASYGRDLYLRRLLDALVHGPWGAAEHNFYFDVATLHLYFNPDMNYDLIRLYRQMLVDYGIDKPIWIVETNAAPSSDPAWRVPDARFAVTLAEQAHFMPQMLAMALAAGAERVAIYKLVDPPREASADPEPFGLVRADGSRRPAFATLVVAATRMRGTTSAMLAERDSWSRVVLTQPGQVTHVLWARWPGGSLAEFPATAASARVYDETGRLVTTLRPRDGEYQVGLAGATCSNNPCLIGGPVLYVIENQ